MTNPDCLQGNDFLNKFLPMYEQIRNMGVSHKDTIKMLITQDFVRDFIDTPGWFISAKKLPQGYKWNDGEKYQLKGEKKRTGETYVFLEVENDLYIKGYYTVIEITGKNPDGNIVLYKLPKDLRTKICVIKNWKDINSNYVNSKIYTTPFLENSINKFWHDHGGKTGYLEPLLKEWRDGS